MGTASLAATANSGEIGVLVWNLTLDQTKAAGSPDLARPVTVALGGLAPGAAYVVHHDRVWRAAAIRGFCRWLKDAGHHKGHRGKRGDQCAFGTD